MPARVNLLNSHFNSLDKRLLVLPTEFVLNETQVVLRPADDSAHQGPVVGADSTHGVVQLPGEVLRCVLVAAHHCAQCLFSFAFKLFLDHLILIARENLYLMRLTRRIIF
jgi:hypothetical protein